MIHIDAEERARTRLERNVAATVAHLRDLAARIEREAKRDIEAAMDARDDYATYGRVAGQLVHAVSWGLANANLSGIIEAATEADTARTQELAALTDRTSVTAGADKLAGAVDALAAMARAVQGWAEGGAQNDIDLANWDRKPTGEQPFVLADILRMIDDAANEVGVAPTYGDVK